MIFTKKAVGVGQVFVFIIAAITFALVTIFGYKAINDFLQKGEQVEFVQFKNELDKSIKEIYTEFGAVRIHQFHLPVKYEQICFVNLDKNINEEDSGWSDLCQEDAYACEVWKQAWEGGEEEPKGYAAADENVFLKPASSSGVRLKVYMISIQGGKGYLCQNIINGQFSLQMMGKGDRTELGPVREEN